MEINVKASKNYKVVIEDNILSYANYIKDFNFEKVAIIVDSNVSKLYPNFLDRFFSGHQLFTYVIDAGEDSKSFNNYINILNFLCENEFKRSDLVVAFGGGVVGDLAGFVSATYMRGVKFINVPTTLLSMVDSSVGGKTAINLDGAKNMVGAFYQPSLVYISVDFLKTLPNRELISGLGEVVKYAFIKKFKDYNDITKELIYDCVDIKREIVEKDEKESNLRKVLNLGHTFGHAIEKASNYALSHGECVLKGLKISLDVSKNLNLLSDENYSTALNMLKKSKANLSCGYSLSTLLEYVKKDKKGNGTSIDFIVVNNDLLCDIKTIEFNDLLKVL